MNSGLGLLPISFDWTQITYAGTPLTTPFYITCNAFAVVVFFYLFLSPILYYGNVWYSAYLPLLSSGTFDNTGAKYNVSRVIDSNLDFVLDKYEAYSPMYISMSYSLTYALSFAAVTAIVVYTYLYNGKEIWAKFKNSRHGGEDIHKRLMNVYEEVPDWWYGVLTLVILGLGIFTIRYWDSGLPVWGFIVVCFGMGVLLIIPEGILEGTTNQRMSVTTALALLYLANNLCSFLNIITEMIAGYAWPGKPIANMMVKCYGYNSVKHGMDFAQDLKLGQYMVCLPMFRSCISTYARTENSPSRPVLGSDILFCPSYRNTDWRHVNSALSPADKILTSPTVLRWMITNIPKLCDPKNTQRFTCNGAKVTYNASLIWGTIGPQRMFQSGQVYHGIMYFFLIGVCRSVLLKFIYIY